MSSALRERTLSRREFLRFTVLGAGAALFPYREKDPERQDGTVCRDTLLGVLIEQDSSKGVSFSTASGLAIASDRIYGSLAPLDMYGCGGQPGQDTLDRWIEILRPIFKSYSLGIPEELSVDIEYSAPRVAGHTTGCRPDSVRIVYPCMWSICDMDLLPATLAHELVHVAQGAMCSSTAGPDIEAAASVGTIAIMASAALREANSAYSHWARRASWANFRHTVSSVPARPG